MMVDPRSRTGLWILPDLWKAQTARLPQVLARRTRRAAHRLHEALRLVSVPKNLLN